MNEQKLIESCIIAVNRSVQNAAYFDWDAVMRFCTEGEEETDSAEYYKAAICIVEPVFNGEEAEDYYYKFMDNDPANWAGWVGNMFEDTRWGELALKVNDVGY